MSFKNLILYALCISSCVLRAQNTTYLDLGSGITYLRTHMKSTVSANFVFYSDPAFAYHFFYGKNIFSKGLYKIDLQAGLYKKGFAFKTTNFDVDSAFRLKMRMYALGINLIGRREVFESKVKSKRKWNFEVKGGLQSSYTFYKKWTTYNIDETGHIRFFNNWQVSALAGIDFIRLSKRNSIPGYAISITAAYELNDLYADEGVRQTLRSFELGFIRYL